MRTLPAIVFLILIASLPACIPPPAATNPMASVPMQPERNADTLVIMLPGRGDRGNDFESRGFFEIARDQGFDVIAADAHFGYYRARTLDLRLREDIVQPARDRGYREIWLLGISAGGFGAMLYASLHPEDIDGLVLLAPWPGDRELVAEISERGGLGRWAENPGTAGEDFQRDTWLWLAEVTEQAGNPEIILGYGNNDRFAPAGALMGARLPSGNHLVQEGGHDWPTWRSLWSEMLETGLIGQQP